MLKKHESYDRTERPFVCSERAHGPVVCNSSNTRQLGCVFQDMEPPKLSSILRKSSDMRKPIRRVKFTKAVARHGDIRDKNPSLGLICPGEPHQRCPNAPKFEDRSQEETEWQEQGAREAAWKLAKNVYTQKFLGVAGFPVCWKSSYVVCNVPCWGKLELTRWRYGCGGRRCCLLRRCFLQGARSSLHYDGAQKQLKEGKRWQTMPTESAWRSSCVETLWARLLSLCAWSFTNPHTPPGAAHRLWQVRAKVDRCQAWFHSFVCSRPFPGLHVLGHQRRTVWSETRLCWLTRFCARQCCEASVSACHPWGVLLLLWKRCVSLGSRATRCGTRPFVHLVTMNTVFYSDIDTFLAGSATTHNTQPHTTTHTTDRTTNALTFLPLQQGIPRWTDFFTGVMTYHTCP